MHRIRLICPLFALLLLCPAFTRANADSMTYSGTFTADDSVFSQVITVASTQAYNFYTTSYAGGVNLVGPASLSGGFDPVLTLFSNATGQVVAFGGGSGMAEGSSGVDPMTGLSEDANFTSTLGPGAYTLFLTQFPNVAVGSLSDGFLFAAQSNFTGDICGVPGGMFLQSDVSPCAQRTGSYSVNVSSTSPVPEPPTWMLVLPATAAIALFGRRQFA
jgi:hypothetical protein